MKYILSVVILLTFIPGISAQKSYFFTGTTNSTEKNPIAVFELDENNAEITLIKKFEGGLGPGYLCISENGDFLYSVNEEIFNKDKGESSVSGFRILRGSEPAGEGGWDLKFTGTQSSKGKHPCHISLDPTGKILFTANYSSGNIASYSTGENGEINPAASFFQHEGSGPVSSRQEGPHAHFIHTSIDGKYVYACDLGTDRVMIYSLKENGALIANKQMEFFALPPGSGPRHMAFHKNGKFVFILNELSNKVVSCRYDRQDGSLAILDVKSTLEPVFKESTKAAAIRVHPGGKFLYCSNRGENSIAVFKIIKDGRLEKIQSFQEGIGVVRDFNISSSGRYLVAGNQDKGEIVLLRIGKDGKLSTSGKRIELSEPTCVVFYPGK